MHDYGSWSVPLPDPLPTDLPALRALARDLRAGRLVPAPKTRAEAWAQYREAAAFRRRVIDWRYTVYDAATRDPETRRVAAEVWMAASVHLAVTQHVAWFDSQDPGARFEPHELLMALVDRVVDEEPPALPETQRPEAEPTPKLKRVRSRKVTK